MQLHPTLCAQTAGNHSYMQATFINTNTLIIIIFTLKYFT